MRRRFAVGSMLFLAALAHAQLRTLPVEARRGEIRHLQEQIVQIDGQAVRLATGAQVRDAHNRVLLPAAIPAGSAVRYTMNARGEVSAVWILTEHEAAR